MNCLQHRNPADVRRLRAGRILRSAFGFWMPKQRQSELASRIRRSRDMLLITARQYGKIPYQTEGSRRCPPQRAPT
jgi:hypothetical protein